MDLQLGQLGVDLVPELKALARERGDLLRARKRRLDESQRIDGGRDGGRKLASTVVTGSLLAMVRHRGGGRLDAARRHDDRGIAHCRLGLANARYQQIPRLGDFIHDHLVPSRFCGGAWCTAWSGCRDHSSRR